MTPSFRFGSINAQTISRSEYVYLDLRIGKKHSYRYGTQEYEFQAGGGGHENLSFEIEHNDTHSQENLFEVDLPRITTFLRKNISSFTQELSFVLDLMTFDRRKIKQIQLSENREFGKQKPSSLLLRRIHLK